MSHLSPTIRQTRNGRAIQLGMLRDVSVFQIDLPLVDLPAELNGLKVLHITDTHFGQRWCEGHDKLLATIAELNADLIAFTGDWVEDKYDFRLGLDVAQRFARGLVSKFGTFSCLGNHDGDLIAPYLLDAGVKLMVGERRSILGGESAIEILGLPGVARLDLSPTLIESFGPRAPSTLRLVLTHYPDHIRQLSPLNAHLVLTGHTHGGQICLPGAKPIITHDSLPKELSSGIHQFGETWMHTSRGIGCAAWNIRVLCPPEITMIRLVRTLDGVAT
jgi:predicted MPP superfamily phosphohydrolase